MVGKQSASKRQAEESASGASAKAGRSPKRNVKRKSTTRRGKRAKKRPQDVETEAVAMESTAAGPAVSDKAGSATTLVAAEVEQEESAAQAAQAAQAAS